MAVKSVIEAVREAIREEMQRDPTVFVMGEDVGARGGVFLATQGLVEEFGEERVIDTPLAEASIVGIALGAAFRGQRPMPEIQFSDFVWPSINQLIGEAARTCYGTNGAVQVPMTVRIPYGGGIRGGLFHSQNVETHFFHTPGLKVVTPCTPTTPRACSRAPSATTTRWCSWSTRRPTGWCGARFPMGNTPFRWDRPT